MRRLFQACLVLFSFLLISVSLPVSAATPTGDVWNGHQVMVDSSNKLVSWIASDYPYDQVMEWGWNYIQNSVPNTSAGIKHYLSYCCYFEPAGGNSNWYHNPAGLYASFVDSLIMAYPYTGSATLVTTVKGMLDYQLANGTTPAGWLWGSMPYASAVNGQTVYQGDGTSVRDGANGIQPDKAAELGYAYLRFWQLTGNTTYRTAAINIANTLVARVRTGNASQSPWPFRVHAQTGAVLEEYTANMVAAVNLFDELIRLNLGNVASYQTVRNQAWNWVLTYPMTNNNWNAYFEDIERNPSLTNKNQVTPMETARYILSRENPATVDPQWQTHIPALLTWVKNTFGKGPFYSAQAIDEQTVCCSAYGLGSHTARWASINALWYERTADVNYRNAAALAFNYATYFSDAQGRVKATFDGGSNWYSDGYGDYIKHFMSGIGSIPEWSPANESHLLRSSSVVTSVTYAVGRVSYTTFDSASRDRLRLNFTPTQVTANGVVLPQRGDLNAAGWTYNAATGVLNLRHDTGTSIVISGGTTAPTATRTPTLQPTNTPVGLQSLWTTSATPAVADVMGIAPIELGVKFRTSTNATITGLRFYKGASNTGTHTGHLWTANGTLLATAVFVNETASGWQAANFPTPININANTLYIISYYSPTGRFSYTADYFATSRSSGILTAPDSVSVGGNGVFTRGANGSFPVSSSTNNNFWVDVLLLPNNTSPTATRTPTATTMAASPTPMPTSLPQSSTVTRQIGAGGDDVNQVGSTYEAANPAVWIGDAGAAGSLAAFRFNNVQVPRGATITAARLEFYSVSGQWLTINLQIAGDDVDNSAAFSASALPSQRVLTTARVAHSSNVNWAANTWYPFTDMSAVVGEIISRPNWQAGNSLSIILSGSGSSWGRKFAAGFEYGAAYAPRLVITYSS
ncbi:MAG: DUF4082 domain-containing protein [Chloroflexi bacterium]|nr:DUF4082 domain-containing protein [Chloroflexota bacterium]MCC6891547.1 DUF4082 domain-containing protein [Anaerolineae bacterium]